MSPRHVAVVPHTHWDREWYEPFQTFRMNLVDTFDSLLDIMEADPSYRHFLVDGQMAAVDDYLEVRPEHEERLRALAGTGRLTMGPWYILLDEFLVSPETIMRDLEMGLARAAAFGGAMDVGYLPDMFGHIAQMPQILRHAGFEHTVVWRGVPSAITKTGFAWVAPDGSEVRAEYLPVGYSNGAVLPDDAKALVRRVEDHESEIGSFLIDEMLLMNGSDHLPPQPWLGRVVAEANALQDDYVFSVSSLPEYVARAPKEGLERWEGELRSGARSNVLMGVTSNRVDVKRSAARTDRALARRAEPYAALFLPATKWPTRLFDIAWREVVRCAAHDSVCACSVDDVVDAVLHRYAEARHVGEGIADRALKAFGASVSEGGQYVVNPSARTRSGVVDVVVSAEEPPGPNVQVVSERFGLPGSMTLDADTVRTILGMLQGPKIDNDAWVHEIRVEEDESGIDLTLFIGPEERLGVPIAEVKADLYTRLGARPDVEVRVRLDQPPIRRIAARVADVPGFGWQRFTPTTLSYPVAVTGGDEGGDGATSTASSEVTITNGLVTVVVEEGGTFSVDGTSGFGRLVDGGDYGDSYNYSPPSIDKFIDMPNAVTVTVGERGPVRATVTIVATYTWPDRVSGGTHDRVGERSVEITTVLDIRADERTVRVSTSFVNPSRDHRLRVHLPLPKASSTSEAECAFTTVERGLEAEGRPDEFGLPTFPAQRFVRAGGLTVVHDGVTEYELVDIEDGVARSIALTVLRSTGMLSRLGLTYRPFPAGPITPVDGLQLTGKKLTFQYALALGDIDPWAMADDVLLPLDLIGAPGGGTRSTQGSALCISGAEVSAVRRRAGMLEIRVFNPSSKETTVNVGHRGWLTDLQSRTLEHFEDSFSLRAQGIATFRLPGV